MRLFLDANVVFSAAQNTDGRAAAIFDLCRKGHGTIMVSPHALEEARRNIDLKYPDARSKMELLLDDIEVCQECSRENAEWAAAQRLPEKDAPILGAAAQGKADLLVTGDRAHFGHLLGKTLRGVLIVTPAEAFARLL